MSTSMLLLLLFAALSHTDDGYYMCASVKQSTKEILHHAVAQLIVLQPVQGLTLKIGNYTFNSDRVNENIYYESVVFTPVTLTCESSGSNPQPNMQIKISGIDVSRRAQGVDRMSVIGSFPNQVRLHTYRLQLTLKESDAGKDIECIASVTGLTQKSKVAARFVFSKGDLRLVDGRTNTSGRVEIFHDGIWGTVCNDYFALRDTMVVCNQLGFGISNIPRVWRDVPAGTGPILLDDLGCRGTEATLTDCRRQPWGQHSCAHRDDVGVECDTRSFVENMRLVGDSPRTGLLQVNYGGRWGPVCSVRFTADDASVACRTLGFDGTDAQIGSVVGNISELLLSNVGCNGNEKSMSECRYTGPFNAARYCPGGGHVTLNCMGPGIINATNVTARLNGGSEVSGRLELSVNGVWGTVCNDGFDNTAAKVACRMLGLPTEHSVVYSFSLTHQNISIVDIWLDDVQCNGTEQSIFDCGHRDLREHNCGHNEDVGVFCTADPHAGHHHEIRLAGSNDTHSGRVEVNYYGIWGTVCNDRWRDSNSQVICRSLNLPFENARVTNVDAFGPRSGPTWLDDVRCGGEELSLFDCQRAALGIENCDHSEDVALICECGEYCSEIVSKNIYYKVEIQGLQ